MALPGAEAGGRAPRLAPPDARGRGTASWAGRGGSRTEQRIGAGQEESLGGAGKGQPPQVEWEKGGTVLDCASERDCVWIGL